MMYSGKLLVGIKGRDEESWTLLEHAWVRSQRGALLCAACDHLAADVYPLPLDLPLQQIPPGMSYDGVLGVGVIHVRLLNELAAHLPAHALGACTSTGATAIDDYRSVYFSQAIPHLRGDRTATYFVCAGCGFVGCASDRRYALRDDIPGGEVFLDRGATLYLEEQLARRFPWRSFPDLEPILIPVHDKPLADDPLFLSDQKPELVVRIPHRSGGYELRCREP